MCVFANKKILNIIIAMKIKPCHIFRNELLPKLRLYNEHYESDKKKALQLASKEVYIYRERESTKSPILYFLKEYCPKALSHSAFFLATLYFTGKWQVDNRRCFTCLLGFKEPCHTSSTVLEE